MLQLPAARLLRLRRALARAIGVRLGDVVLVSVRNDRGAARRRLLVLLPRRRASEADAALAADLGIVVQLEVLTVDILAAEV